MVRLSLQQAPLQVSLRWRLLSRRPVEERAKSLQCMIGIFSIPARRVLGGEEMRMKSDHPEACPGRMKSLVSS